MFAGTAKALPGGDSSSGVFAGVMHQHDREVQPPLQGAEVGQEPGHFGGVVLVDSVKSYQGGPRAGAGAGGRLAVSKSRERCGSRSSLRTGAVITWMSTAFRSSPRCRAIPSTRWRTTGKASSAR